MQPPIVMPDCGEILCALTREAMRVPIAPTGPWLCWLRELLALPKLIDEGRLEFHRIAQARRMLVGIVTMSAQDLRERLGAVALSVYRKESGFLPTRAEVTEVVRSVMKRQRGDEVPKVEADRFIQKVAESTGLIALGGDEKGDDAAIVTFMHHSFMEYFAAVGLSRELETLDLVSLVTQPRWIEILTLLAGIIGEGEDIAPVLARCIGDGTGFGEVDARFLIFALDCALECEVPSEASIRLLRTSIVKCVESGPGRRDPWVRSEIGRRMSQLLSACGLSAFEGTIADLIRSSDAEVCAAGISLAGFACSAELESAEILKAVEQSCSRLEEGTRCAICEAAAKVKWLRSPAVLQAVASCLKKSIRCKQAAFEAILAIPGLAAVHWPAIINGLDETTSSVRQLAGRAAVQAGLDGDLAALNDAKKDVVANALQSIHDSALDQDYPSSKIHQETVQHLLNSGYVRDRLIGIQLLPAVESTDDYAYRKLMEILKDSQDHQEMTAALRALCSSGDARLLMTVGDLKRVAKLCEAGTTDVRKTSVRLLGHFGADAHAVRALLDRDISSVDALEYAAIFASLGRAAVLEDEVASIIEKEIMRRVGGEAKRNASYVKEMCALLDAAQSLKRNLPPNVASTVRQLIRDYKEDEEVKRAALRAYPAAAIPTRQVVEFLTDLFIARPVMMVTDLVYTPGIFAEHCRQNIDYVVACVEAMPRLRDAAIELHRQLSKKILSTDIELAVTALRDGIHEVSQIIVTFDEFISPGRSLTA